MVGNRALQISEVERGGDRTKGWKYEVTTAIKDSISLLIHGSRDSWEGNIAYADGHAELHTSLAPQGNVSDNKWLAYTTRDDKRFLDCPFFDEEDDKNGSNAFLGIFLTAGKDAKDFHGIWD